MLNFNAVMINSKLIENKTENNNLLSSENLYKGACVKIRNNNKTFQVIGINQQKQICWVREWPFNYNSKKTFVLNISQITIKVLCSNDFKMDTIS